MNQVLTAHGDVRRKTIAPIETPTLLAPGRAPVTLDGFAYIGEVRTHLTTILGFAEMLADPTLALSAQTRAEYGEIVATSGALLTARIERRDEELGLAS